MDPRRHFTTLFAAGLCACGGDTVPGEAGSSAGSVDPPTTAPTTGAMTSTGTSATGGSATEGHTGTPTSTTAPDPSSGTSTSSGPGPGPSSTSSSTGLESSSSSGASTGEGATTGLPEACGSDTSAEPTPWSVSRGVSGRPLNVATIGAPPGAIVYTASFDDVIDLGGGPIDPGGATHVFLVSHATSGAFQWAEHVGGPPMTVNITGFDAATDCEGNVVLAGTFSGQIEAQGLSLVAAPGVEFDDGMEFPTADVFLMKFGPDGTLLWAQRFGDQASQRLRGVDVQSDGTIVVAGDVQGTLDLGGPPIVVDGPWPGAVLAAFDPGGAFLWQHHATGSQGVQFGRFDVGPDDRISVLASATGTTDLGGGALPYNGAARILAQFAADGSHRWSHRWQHPSHMPSRIGGDAAGGTIVGGYAVPGDDTFPGFVLRHDADGAFQWEHVFLTDPNSTDRVDVESLATADEVAVLGRFRGTFDFGGGDLSAAAPETAMFVTRYDLAGGHLASAAFAATLAQSPNASAYGPDGEVVVGGIFQGSFDLGGGPMVAVGEADLFVHRFSPDPR